MAYLSHSVPAEAKRSLNYGMIIETNRILLTIQLVNGK